jgi:hypothetical protein
MEKRDLFDRLPILPVVFVVVALTVAFGKEGWVLTASWVLVGVLAWMADRKMRRAEALALAQSDQQATLEPGSVLPAPEAVQMLPAPPQALTRDRLH